MSIKGDYIPRGAERYATSDTDDSLKGKAPEMLQAHSNIKAATSTDDQI